MLKTLREAAQHTGGSLGLLVGLSKDAISKIERGKRQPSLSAAIGIINALALTDAQAMALLRELAAAGAPAAEPPPATTPAPTPRPHQEAA